jgi:hypothetical protein
MEIAELAGLVVEVLPDAPGRRIVRHLAGQVAVPNDPGYPGTLFCLLCIYQICVSEVT